jgi:hypothetical protein
VKYYNNKTKKDVLEKVGKGPIKRIKWKMKVLERLLRVYVEAKSLRNILVCDFSIIIKTMDKQSVFYLDN